MPLKDYLNKQLEKMKTTISQSLKIHSALSILTIMLGGGLIIYMITVEGELGAIPLFLVLVGSGWFFWSVTKIKKQTK